MAQKKKLNKNTEIVQKAPENEVSYKIRAGAPFKQEDAGPIAAELMRLTRENNGALTAQQVLESAQDPLSPLHQYFEWDAQKAAQRYRLVQARTIIKSVSYSVKTGKVVIDTAAFVRIFNNDELPKANRGPAYIPIPTAIEVVDFQQQVLMRALQELKSFQARYKNLSEVFTGLAPVFRAIGEAELLISAKKKAE